MYFRVFDCWRFAAAILVMTYHFLFWGPASANAAADWLHRLLPLLDMFFMISGFFITTRYGRRIGNLRDYGGFLRRRIGRLYPLHFITTMFFALVAVAAGLVGADHYPFRAELSALPSHLLALHALGFTQELHLNYVSWSVSAEIFSYVMFPLIVFAIGFGGRIALGLLVVVEILALEIASSYGVFGSAHWTHADAFGAYRTLADFTIGAFLAECVATRPFKWRTPWLGLIGMALSIGAMIQGLPWMICFAGLAFSLFAAALSEVNDPHSTRYLAVLMPLTATSFGIYIWHPVLEFLFLTVVWQRWLEPLGAMNFYVFMLVPMVATIFVAFFSFRFVEPYFAAYIVGPRPDGKPHKKELASS